MNKISKSKSQNGDDSGFETIEEENEDGEIQTFEHEPSKVDIPYKTVFEDLEKIEQEVYY